MPELKTKPTAGSVDDYLASIADPARRADCVALAGLLARATGETAMMWGTSIVGFGSYHYRYASGHEGDTCVVGFSSRKGDITVYGLVGSPERAALLPQLGKHKTGKGCLYIRRLADVDLQVLERLIVGAFLEKKDRPA
ncbi:MAG TPA: DUF1801 domain-containing protein [Thermoanaerobaculia bacterium]